MKKYDRVVDIAAPLIPYLGIKYIFKLILSISPTTGLTIIPNVLFSIIIFLIVICSTDTKSITQIIIARDDDAPINASPKRIDTIGVDSKAVTVPKHKENHISNDASCVRRRLYLL